MSVELVVSFLVFAIGSVLTFLEFRKARTREERWTRWLKVSIAVLGAIGIHISWSSQQPREISLATQEAMVESLSAHAGETVSLHYVANDSEAYEFAQELRDVLTRSGWNVRDGFRVSGPGSPASLELRVLSEQPTAAALALANLTRNNSLR